VTSPWCLVQLAHQVIRFRWVYCQLETLRRCFPNAIRRALDELPETLDETYERTLLGIEKEKWEYAHRLFQCLTVAIRPLRVDELAEVLAIRFHDGQLPRYHADWQLEDAQDAVLSACSSLISVVHVDGSPIVQFSHFSVKEFLTSDRLLFVSSSILATPSTKIGSSNSHLSSTLHGTGWTMADSRMYR
jgi:hypothetical protein